MLRQMSRGRFVVNFVIKVEKRCQCSRLLYIFIVYCYWSFLWFSLCFSAFNSIEVVLYWRNKYIKFILQHIYGIVKVNIMNCWIKNAVFGEQLKNLLKFPLLMFYWKQIFLIYDIISIARVVKTKKIVKIHLQWVEKLNLTSFPLRKELSVSSFWCW